MNEEELKSCPFCKEKYSKKLKTCPHCHYKEPFTFDKALWVFIILLLPFTFIRIAQEHKLEANFSLSKVMQSKNAIERQEIKINPMTELSGLSKDEIYSQRIRYVRDSVAFKNIEKYFPNENVYNIDSFLPWVGAEQAVKYGAVDNLSIGNGISRSSMLINNPELLIGFLVVDYGISKRRSGYSDSIYLQPKKMYWKEKEKTIEAHFDITSFKNDYPMLANTVFYTDDTNARDLGYEWVFAYDVSNVAFKDYNRNIRSKIYKLRGYYHRGYACGLKDGCNNYSPLQEELLFRVLDKGYMRIKMWKKKPFSVLQNPDLTYVMYFD